MTAHVRQVLTLVYGFRDHEQPKCDNEGGNPAAIFLERARHSHCVALHAGKGSASPSHLLDACMGWARQHRPIAALCAMPRKRCGTQASPGCGSMGDYEAVDYLLESRVAITLRCK